jgi:hypothetical protein
VSVTFCFPAAIWAETVDLVLFGDNGEATNVPMLYFTPDDAWQVTLELERGHSLVYSYLVDGQNWCNEWHSAAKNDGAGFSERSLLVA